MPDSSTASRSAPLFRSIGVKLFLWTFLVMLVVFGVFGYLSFQSTSEQWTRSMRQSAYRTSELIERAIHDGMLLNRKDAVHKTIRSIAKSPGVAGIRIYDKSGTIIFSADEREIGRRVDRQAEACVRCHERNKPLRSLPQKDRVRIFEDASGNRILGLIKPILNEPSCSDAACHAHPPNKSILGVLDVKMSIAHIDKARKKARRDAILMLLLMALAGGLAAALFIYRVVLVPVRRLTDGIGRISSGNLDTRIELVSRDEMGELAESFNFMSAALRDAGRENRRWADKLEAKVEEKTEQLSRIHGQIAHMEKMASLGKLAATVAHELNNPLAGVLVYAGLVQRRLSEVKGEPVCEEMQRHVKLIREETARCGDIVKNLLVFARESRVVVAEHRLGKIVERSLKLIGHELELQEIELKVIELDDDELACDAHQIQQAIMALLVNAIEAMEPGGLLTVTQTGDVQRVWVDIQDTGPGIPDDVVGHIFEPFFSTKEATKGVGLGLSVVYGIIHRHGGTIDVESFLGHGTCFRIELPREPKVGLESALGGPPEGPQSGDDHE